MFYRFVLQLDGAEDDDPEFERIEDVSDTMIVTRQLPESLRDEDKLKLKVILDHAEQFILSELRLLNLDRRD